MSTLDEVFKLSKQLLAMTNVAKSFEDIKTVIQQPLWSQSSARNTAGPSHVPPSKCEETTKQQVGKSSHTQVLSIED